MHLTSSMEDYLKTIFILYRKQGYARCVDISEYMGVTMPSVSRAVKELIKAEYLMKEVNGTLSLTIAGEKLPKTCMNAIAFFGKSCLRQALIFKQRKRMLVGWNTESVRNPFGR